jgi:hypothetical protein
MNGAKILGGQFLLFLWILRDVFRSTLMIIQDKSSQNIIFRCFEIITFFDNSLPIFAQFPSFFRIKGG